LTSVSPCFAARTGKGPEESRANKGVCQAWKEKVTSLQRPASATLEAFLFDADDPRVHKGRQMLALPVRRCRLKLVSCDVSK